MLGIYRGGAESRPPNDGLAGQRPSGSGSFE